MDVKQEDSDLEHNLKMKVPENSSMQPKSKMGVQEDLNVRPQEKSNMQPKSKMRVQGGSNLQRKSSVVFHEKLIMQLTWTMVVPEDSHVHDRKELEGACKYVYLKLLISK